MPYIGRSANFGVRTVFHYLASNGDTSVSGADADGKTLTFADGNYIDVYLNGVRLKSGEDYNTNTANTVAGMSSLNANDEVNVIVYDAFSLVTAFDSLGGTFGGDVTVSTDLNVGDDLSLTSDSQWVASKLDVNPQSVDQSKIVPVLTAALQESITKIETLETKVKALEDA